MGRDAQVEPLPLVMLGLGALVVRLPGLRRSLWYDELFTLIHFAGSPGDAVTEQVAANNHPLASLILWAVGLIAESEPGMRLPFVVLGALAAPALAWSLATWLGRRQALVAGALLALAPAAVSASQQLRGYAGLLLAAALVLGLLPRAWAGSRRAAIALAVVVGLGLWSHATLLLGVLLLVPGVALGGRLGLSHGGRREALGGLLGGLLLGALLYAPILDDMVRFGRRALLVSPPEGLHPGPLNGGDLLQVLGGGSLPLALVLLLSATVGAVSMIRGRTSEESASLLPALLLLAPLGGVALLFLVRPLGYGRFLLFALPAFLALAAQGLTVLGRRPLPIALALLCCLGLAAWDVREDQRRELQDYRSVMLVAQQRSDALGGVPVIGLGPGAEVCGVYGKRDWVDLTGQDVARVLRRADPPPMVCVVFFPRWLESEEDLHRALHSGAFYAPIVIPGRESDVLVFAARTRR